jgi:glycosyltransferase involved in cell wall biosynthesis
LSGLIDSLKLGEYVRLTGERDRDWLFAHLCEYHALIQPSLYEGFGLTILEGFAAGLPVVASDTGGPAEILSEMPGGLRFHSGDAGDCSKTLLQLLTLYRNGDIEEKIHHTVPLAQKKYSIESCANEYLTEYLKILN